MKCPACQKEIEVIQEKEREVAFCNCNGQTRAVWEHIPAPAKAKEPVVKKDGEK